MQECTVHHKENDGGGAAFVVASHTQAVQMQ